MGTIVDTSKVYQMANKSSIHHQLLPTSKTNVDANLESEWVLHRDLIESVAEENVALTSSKYNVQVGNENITYTMQFFPKGYKSRRGKYSSIFLKLDTMDNSTDQTIDLAFAMKDNKGVVDGKRKYRTIKACRLAKFWYGCSNFHLIKDLSRSYDRHNKLIVVACLQITVRDNGNRYVQNMQSIINFDSFSDLTIICGRKKFRCHKVIMAARSTVFKAMLENEMQEKKTNEVKIEDSSPKAVKMMIDFIYTDKLPENVDPIAVELIHLAVKYDLASLIQICEVSLLSNLCNDNALTTLIALDTYRPTSSTRQEIVKHIAAHALDIIKSEEWGIFAKDHPNLTTDILRQAVASKDESSSYDSSDDESDIRSKALIDRDKDRYTMGYASSDVSSSFSRSPSHRYNSDDSFSNDSDY